MSAVLEVKDLRTTFPLAGRRVPIVDGISFSVDAGQVLAIVGESGSGKSITALSVLRLVPKPGRIDGGRVLLDGKNLLEANIPAMRRVRGHDIAMIFQEPMTSLNPVVRVGAQVMEAVLLTSASPRPRRGIGVWSCSGASGSRTRWRASTRTRTSSPEGSSSA